MDARLVIALLCIIMFSAGCLGSEAPAAELTTPNSNYMVNSIQYASGAFNVSALLCEPVGSNSSTPGIVLTGGDGVTLELLKPACEAFARKGLAALAHEGVNGSLGDNVDAVMAGAERLRVDSPARPITLWGHSSGDRKSVV